MGVLKDFMAGALHASVVSLPWRLPGAVQAGSIAGARRALSPVLVCRASCLGEVRQWHRAAGARGCASRALRRGTLPS